VNNKLESLDEKLDLLRKESSSDRQAIRQEIRSERQATRADISRLSDKIDRLEHGLTNGNSPYVTWSYLRDKLLIPIVLAGIVFLLFTVFPWLIIVGYVVTGKGP